MAVVNAWRDNRTRSSLEVTTAPPSESSSIRRPPPGTSSPPNTSTRQGSASCNGAEERRACVVWWALGSLGRNRSPDRLPAIRCSPLCPQIVLRLERDDDLDELAVGLVSSCRFTARPRYGGGLP